MHPHGESSEVRLSPTNDKAQRLLDPTVAPEITTITCAVCGKAGVSICAKCSKKGRRYKTALARANPLQERDPELYKRLDEMSRLSLQGNRQVFDEFCIEIKAGGFYELCLATIQNAPGAVHTQEFSDIRICLVCGVEWPDARDSFVTG